MALIENKIEPTESGTEKCWFLLITTAFSAVLLLILNFYIGYKIIESFKGDGWLFLEGLFIGSTFMVTVPALIFSVISVKMVRNNHPKKYIFPVITGIVSIFAGFILNNATGLWIYILLFGVTILVSVLICSDKKQNRFKNKFKQVFKNRPAATVKSENGTGKTYKIAIIFQSVGLSLLFIVTLVSTFALFDSDKSSDQIIGFLVSVFLLLIHGIVTVAFFKKRKWALLFKYIESYILLGLTVLLFLAALITEGISFSKQTFLIVFFFVLLILLFVYLIRNYKKLKHSNLFLFVFIVLTGSLFSFKSLAQEKTEIQKVYLLDKNDFNPYLEFYSTDITDYFNPEKSGKYPSTNLFDGNLKTCWVAGLTEQKNNPVLFIKVPGNIPADKLIFNIFSGYGKTRSLYYKNARPRKIKISLFSAFSPEGFSTEVASLYFIQKYSESKTVELADTFGVQSFNLNLNNAALSEFQKRSFNACRSVAAKELQTGNDTIRFTPAFILKIETEDIYKGSKYNDVCISEIFFNDRFVTAYPRKYRQVDTVYIKNDNTLIADYAGEKGVVIVRDTAVVYTLVYHPRYSNWAILSFADGDSSPRVEEHYLLIDLKNRQITDEKTFKKCTGSNLFSPLIEKDMYGKTILDLFDGFTVELK